MRIWTGQYMRLIKYYNSRVILVTKNVSNRDNLYIHFFNVYQYWKIIKT